MDGKFGVITSVVDENKFVIKFTIEGWIQDAVAYPLNQKDEPNEGDPIFVLILESEFGYSFMYQKLKLKDFIRFKLKNSEVDITEDNVQIMTKSGNEVIINSDGDVSIRTNGDINISAKGEVNVKADADVNLKAGGSVLLDAPMIELKGKYVGDPSSVGEGGFSISQTGPAGLCPLTMAPHVCSRLIKS